MGRPCFLPTSAYPYPRCQVAEPLPLGLFPRGFVLFPLWRSPEFLDHRVHERVTWSTGVLDTLESGPVSVPLDDVLVVAKAVRDLDPFSRA